ncbi:hypothetical protein JW796_00200 [Candidatus Dojkabacteria bacterium]|nr:hypothetical protein [Candidatus Dojkabacteria bacterium]
MIINDEDFSEASRSPLYVVNISKPFWTESITIRIYPSRISIIKKSKFGFWEHQETYPTMDLGDIIVNQGFSGSKITVRRRNTMATLFVIENLSNSEARDLKSVLNAMILKTQKSLIQPVNYNQEVSRSRSDLFEP